MNNRVAGAKPAGRLDVSWFVSHNLVGVRLWRMLYIQGERGGVRQAMLNTDDLEQFRKLLQNADARLRGDVRQLEEEALSTKGSGDHGSSNHIAEMGSDSWERDFSLRMAAQDGEFLKEVSHALAKFELGTFGLCEMCLEAGVSVSRARIPKARLKAIPYARHCVECERKHEEEE